VVGEREFVFVAGDTVVNVIPGFAGIVEKASHATAVGEGGRDVHEREFRWERGSAIKSLSLIFSIFSLRC